MSLYLEGMRKATESALLDPNSFYGRLDVGLGRGYWKSRSAYATHGSTDYEGSHILKKRGTHNNSD